MPKCIYKCHSLRPKCIYYCHSLRPKCYLLCISINVQQQMWWRLLKQYLKHPTPIFYKEESVNLYFCRTSKHKWDNNSVFVDLYCLNFLLKLYCLILLNQYSYILTTTQRTKLKKTSYYTISLDLHFKSIFIPSFFF